MNWMRGISGKATTIANATPENPTPVFDQNPRCPDVSFRAHELIIGLGLRTRQYIAYSAIQLLILRCKNGDQPLDWCIKYEIISSQSQDEATGGDAWGLKQDGCINTAIPPPPTFPDIDLLPPRYNDLIEDIEDAEETGFFGGDIQNNEEDEARAAKEEARLDMELTIGELLRVAKHADYQDEIGRRKMFQLVSKSFLAKGPQS